jgi:hypothetical protein
MAAAQANVSYALAIAEILTGHGGGLIGIESAPGETPTVALGEWHARDRAADLDSVAAWNAAMVISLDEPHDFGALSIAQIGKLVRQRHMEWEHWPVAGFGAQLFVVRGGVAAPLNPVTTMVLSG